MDSRAKFEFALLELINQLIHKVYVRGQDIRQSNEQLVERGWGDGLD